MLSGYRTRAYPNAAQAAALRIWVGHQRFIYNAKVREAEYWRSFGLRSLALTGKIPRPDQAYSHFIGEDTAFLKDVPSQILRNGAFRFATACVRSQKGLSGAPTVRRKHGRQSVMLTAELFRFASVRDEHTGDFRQHLHLGTKTRDLGRLVFKAKKNTPFTAPKSLCISIEPDGRWYLSFCYEPHPALGPAPRAEAELVSEFGSLSPADLADATVGVTGGVGHSIATSETTSFAPGVRCVQRIQKREARARRYERRMRRQKRGSSNQAKTRQRIARLRAYETNVRKDFAHKTSHALVTSPAKVFAFGEIKAKTTTHSGGRSARAEGRCAIKGAAATTDRTRTSRPSPLRLVKQYTSYKAERRDKLLLTLTISMATTDDDAEHSVARHLKDFAVAALIERLPVPRSRKSARVHNSSKVGQVLPEPGASLLPVETPNLLCGSTATDVAVDEAGSRKSAA